MEAERRNRGDIGKVEGEDTCSHNEKKHKNKKKGIMAQRLVGQKLYENKIGWQEWKRFYGIIERRRSTTGIYAREKGREKMRRR